MEKKGGSINISQIDKQTYNNSCIGHCRCFKCGQPLIRVAFPSKDDIQLASSVCHEYRLLSLGM
jgi:hypothetical protein